MKKVDIIFIIVSFVFGIVCYLSINNLILSVLVVLIYLVYYFVLLRKKFVNYFTFVTRIHTCYHFINSFIITLSVKESYEEAFKSATRINNKVLNDQVKELSNYNIYDRVKYLRKYFNLGIYKMFLNVLDLYQDQGGNILNMSDNLISECTRTEKLLSESKEVGFKHLIEFFILWTMSIAILLFMRFGMSDIYASMIKNNLVVAFIFMFFLFALLSIHLFFTTYTNLTIKEDSGS